MSESAARAFSPASSSLRWPLPRLAPSQAPQSARRKDEGEDRGHAEREECKDKEEASAGLGDLADSMALHVDDGDDRPNERPEQDDDVTRSPFDEHQRSVKPKDQDEHSSSDV